MRGKIHINSKEEVLQCRKIDEAVLGGASLARCEVKRVMRLSRRGVEGEEEREVGVSIIIMY